jgi:hypothetical protein
MIAWVARGARPVLSLCHIAHNQQHGSVLSCRLSIVAVSCEWSIGSVLHYSHTVAVYPHILQALNVPPACTSCRPMMAPASDTLKICACTLETREPNCIDRPVRSFFMLEAYGPQGTVGCIAALEPS